MKGGKLLDLGAIAAANYYGSKMVDPGTFRWQSPLAKEGSDSMFTDYRFIGGAAAVIVDQMGWAGHGTGARVVEDLGIAALGNLAATEGLRANILATHAKNPSAQIGDQVRGEPEGRRAPGFAFR